MSKNPFEEFYRVWNAQELIDHAFSKASSRPPSLPKTLPHIEKVKRKEIKRVQNSVNVLTDKIKNIIKSVPNLDALPQFYRQLSHLLVNNDDLRQALGRLNGVVPVLARMEKEYRRKIGRSTTAKQCGERRIEFFGRCTSVIKQQNETLEFLEDCRIKLQQVPPINLNFPCVVVAGYPNVGKSTIVGQLSSAKPQVSEYPFTTKQIYLGLYKDEYGSRYFQVIDTPGILDRPMFKRNTIEKQAILALQTIATVILFIFDPTAASGYTIENQVALLNEIRENFSEELHIPIKIIFNKIDFARPEEIKLLLNKIDEKPENIIQISAKNGTNVNQIQKYLLDYFKSTNYQR